MPLPQLIFKREQKVIFQSDADFRVVFNVTVLWKHIILPSAVPFNPMGRRKDHSPKQTSAGSSGLSCGWMDNNFVWYVSIWAVSACFLLIKESKYLWKMSSVYRLQQLVSGHRHQLLQHGFDSSNWRVEARELLVYLVGVVFICTVCCHFPAK